MYEKTDDYESLVAKVHHKKWQDQIKSEFRALIYQTKGITLYFTLVL